MNEEGTEAGGAEARIRQLIAEKKQLEAQLAEAREKGAAADKWQAKYEEAQASHKAEREAARLERDMLAAGLTDSEGIDFALTAYNKLPAEGRPPIGEWLSNRDALPRAVKAYLSEPAAPAKAEAPTPPAPATVTMPRSNTGAVAQPSPQPNAWSAEAISKLTREEWKANSAAILASLATP